jgi:hypothetical protein
MPTKLSAMTGAQGGYDGSEDQPIHLCEASALYDVSQHRVNQIFLADSSRKKVKTPEQRVYRFMEYRRVKKGAQ